MLTYSVQGAFGQFLSTSKIFQVDKNKLETFSD